MTIYLFHIAMEGMTLCKVQVQFDWQYSENTTETALDTELCITYSVRKISSN